MALLPSIPFDADTWRLSSAAVSVLTLFLLTVAVRIYGHELTYAWRNVVRIFLAFLAVIAYLAVVRAKSTPASFPAAEPDFGLVILVGVGAALLVAAIGIFESHRR